MEQITPEKIMQVGMGFWASKTLLSAVEMELLPNWPSIPKTWRPSRDDWACIHVPHAIFWMPW